MAEHRVFGSGAPPYGLSVMSNATPYATAGNYLYPYGAMATGWYCTGGRVFIPNDAVLFSQSIIIKMWRVGTSPVDLSTAPLRSVTVTTPASSGWVEATWTPVLMSGGQLAFIAYEFPAPRQGYYIAVSSPSNDPIRSVEDVDLALAAATVTATDPDTSRGAYRIGTGSTTAITMWFGVDIIVSDDIPAMPTPIAAYSFDETSGVTAYDSSGSNHHLALNSSSNLGAGRTGNGLYQLSSGKLDIVNAAPWMETAQRTMMFWGRRGSEGTNQYSHTVYMLNDGWTVWGILLNTNTNEVLFRARINSSDVNLNYPEIAVGTWAHYAITYDGAKVTALINGVVVAQSAIVGTIALSDGELSIYGADHQDLVIDDLRLFDTALTDDEITHYMNTAVTPYGARSGKVKVWNGAAWVAHPAKVWNGAEWVTRKAKGHNGTEFIDGKG